MQQQNFCQLPNWRALLIVGVLSLMVSSVQGDDYFKEPPSFLIPCKLHDSKNGECLANLIRGLFSNWTHGVPGLYVGRLDPFNVKKVHLEQSNPNFNMNLDITNMAITGLGQLNIAKISINNDYNFKLLIKIPRIHIEGDYRIKGSIALLPLNSTGALQADISDGIFFVSIKTKLYNNFNQQFFDISSVQSNIKNIGNFHVKFGNLFGGSRELGDSINDIFNQNWRELFEIMRPVLAETLDALFVDRYRRIFNYIPANYFFVDLP